MWVTDLIRLRLQCGVVQPVASFEALAEGLGCAPEASSKLDANEKPYGPPPLCHRRVGRAHLRPPLPRP
jgi:hypothetical protein